MAQRLENTLRFMKHSREDFEKAFNTLDYTDYYKTRDNKLHQSRIYVFEKNDSEKGNLYIKFLISTNEDQLKVLSFHPTDRPLNFFFKELQ